MADEFKEPEEQTAPVDQIDKDMLTEEPVIDRSGASNAGSGPTVNEFVPPPFTGAMNEEPPGDTQQKSESPFANQALADMPASEKLEAARHVAQAIVIGVDTGLKELGNFFLLIRQKTVKELEEEGLLNLNAIILYSNGDRRRIEEAIEGFNQRAKDCLSLSDEYKEAAIDILSEELAKRDIGMTKLQYFLFVQTTLEAKRLIKKIIDIKSYKNEFLEACINTSQLYGRPQSPPPHASTSENQQTAQAENPSAPEQATNEPVQESTESHGQHYEVYNDPGQNREEAIAAAFDQVQQGQSILSVPSPILPADVVQHLSRPATTKKRGRKPGSKDRKKRKPKSRNFSKIKIS